MKTLFARMAIGDQKYADPTPVLRSITDDEGESFKIGNQMDIGEFNGIFLTRI
jgi:hypothetical protein